MPKAVLLLVLVLLGSQPALASHTACTFAGGEAPQYYELEFVGYDDVEAVIVFSATAFASGKRTTLPPAQYTLRAFERETATVSLEFRNPGDKALPPSFRLAGDEGHATLTVGSTRIDGTFTCGD